MSRRERRQVPEHLKQVGEPLGMEEVTLDDWAPALIKNISYDAQLTTIRLSLIHIFRNKLNP